MMTVDYEYLTKEEKKKLAELEEKVQHAKTHDEIKKYTTEMTLLYEKARVREETNHS
ncbi:hypothetical protein [Alteribacillus sp. HJP-4]|uniref:hypothetical protein n=1 Tax=Alteribacillus sp. HJP-4 TaxID=2775394 RepID=UPI0035CD2953